MKDEEQVTRAACSKAAQIHRAVEEGQLSCRQSLKIRGTEARTDRQVHNRAGQLASMAGTATCGVARRKARSRGQLTEPATEEGANPVPPPVTPTDRQGKNLDARMDDALGIDGSRLLMQFILSNEKGRPRTPAPVARGEAEGGASQIRNEKNGE